MMEFWHCCKPGEEDHHHHHGHKQQSGTANGNGAQTKADEKSLAARGYGASSAVEARQGIGYVDLISLLFAEADCSGRILVSLAPVSQMKKLLGIKKVAKPDQHQGGRSVACSPIQMP
jgi:hypothetical protein